MKQLCLVILIPLLSISTVAAEPINFLGSVISTACTFNNPASKNASNHHTEHCPFHEVSTEKYYKISKKNGKPSQYFELVTVTFY